jgi:hypothetical protein
LQVRAEEQASSLMLFGLFAGQAVQKLRKAFLDGWDFREQSLHFPVGYIAVVSEGRTFPGLERWKGVQSENALQHLEADGQMATSLDVTAEAPSSSNL